MIKGILVQLSFLILTFYAIVSCGQNDVTKSDDEPGSSLISSYPGSNLVYSEEKEFTEYHIATGPVTGYKTISDWVTVGGALSRKYYELPGDVTVTQIYRNYLDALQKANFEILAEGVNPARNVGKEVGGDSWMGIFYEKNPFPVSEDIKMQTGSSSVGGSGFIAAKLSREGSNVYVAIAIKEYSEDLKVYMIDVLEETTMKGDLITINAEQMLKGIAADGKIALYGIYFDSGKSSLKPESDATLTEIATLLSNSPSLNVYIVGHTDMQNALEYNINLSQQRAEAVVNELISRLGVSPDRITPQGVGPLCPVATNDTDNGRQKNRRVELVAK